MLSFPVSSRCSNITAVRSSPEETFMLNGGTGRIILLLNFMNRRIEYRSRVQRSGPLLSHPRLLIPAKSKTQVTNLSFPKPYASSNPELPLYNPSTVSYAVRPHSRVQCPFEPSVNTMPPAQSVKLELFTSFFAVVPAVDTSWENTQSVMMRTASPSRKSWLKICKLPTVLDVEEN